MKTEELRKAVSSGIVDFEVTGVDETTSILKNGDMVTVIQIQNNKIVIVKPWTHHLEFALEIKHLKIGGEQQMETNETTIFINEEERIESINDISSRIAAISKLLCLINNKCLTILTAASPTAIRYSYEIDAADRDCMISFLNARLKFYKDKLDELMGEL